MIDESISDYLLSYRILNDLGIAWTDYEAYKLGLIDRDGKKIKSPESKKEKDAYSSYWRIIFNLKRLLQKMTGKNQFAQRAVSLLLLKEDCKQRTIDIICEELELINLQEENKLYEQSFVELHRLHK